jgi:outer membrane protein OmpA-like peptidoglycan-associated protein
MRPLRIVGSCHQRWEDMRGVGRVRHCEACAEYVHDLSRMTRLEALAYVLERGGRLCARAPADEHGGVVLGSGRTPTPRRATPLLAATLGAAVAACGGSEAVTAPVVAATHVPSCPLAPVPAPSVAPSDQPGLTATEGPADKDSDGIPDDADACPKVAGRASADPKTNGCPQIVVTVSTGMTILQQVTFARGNTSPSPDSDPIVRDTAEALRTHPSITKVEVGGHASLDDPTPQQTSEARAANVVARLVALGVDRGRLIARGYGTAQPLASSATKEGRARNRRVEFRVVGTSP